MGPRVRGDDGECVVCSLRLLHRLGKARLRRAGPQRLLLAFVGRPAGQPDHVESGADAAVGIGKALAIDVGHPQHGAAPRRDTYFDPAFAQLFRPPCGSSTNTTGVPFLIFLPNKFASQFVSRMQPRASALLTFEGLGVPWMPYPSADNRIH